MGKEISIKELDKTEFPEETRELHNGVFYTSFAIFVLGIAMNKEELKYKREKLEDFVLGFIQNNEELIDNYFDNQDVIWDVYIVLLVDFDLDLASKIKIESNRLYCKKVILNYDADLSRKENLSKLILFQNLKPEMVNTIISEERFRNNLSKKTKDEKLISLIKENSLDEANNFKINDIIENWLVEVENKCIN
ncbi:ABC-three component system middle component 1 [Halonatronum saccharophilum]|uniref:ABC-three component system middle component 1 n=1 Tax=Halonatronum saccharophilum TaxID=150060 RepID=UPI0004899EC4|nr:ABC-three component system middle component 1 [Halonatronum saccharophilum]